MAAIGNGGAVESLPPPDVDDEMEAAVDLADGEDEMVPISPASNGFALTDSDRARLNAVLRDLLECKRLLERARE